MARPIVLIQRKVLIHMFERYCTGVPVTTLIKQNGLNLSSPTVKKLFDHLQHIVDFESKGSKQDLEMVDIIRNSLFPDWLADNENIVVSQDIKKQIYSGTMPVGTWKTI